VRESERDERERGRERERGKYV